MDAQYVKETVAPAIVEGLTAVVRSQPQDPVEFLGRFLVSYADHLEGVQKSKLATEEVKQQIALQQQQKQQEENEKKIKEENDPVRKLESAEAAVRSVLDGAVDIDAAVLQAFVSKVASMLGLGYNVYLAERTGTPSSGEEGTPGAKIKYIASTQDFVTSATITEPEGVTFKSWIMPEVPPPEEPEEGAEPKPAPPPPELPMVHVPNVLKEKGIVFHGVPRPGSYVASPLTYNSVIHDKAIPEGGPVTAEDGTVTLPAAVPNPRSLAICADTINTTTNPNSFSEAQIMALKRCAGYLKLALERVENAAYTAEYNAYYMPKPADAEAADIAEANTALESVTKAAEESATAEITAAGEAAPDDLKTLIKSTALMKATLGVVKDRIAGLTNQVAARRIPPKESVTKLLTAVWFMLGYRKETLGDAGSPDPQALAWSVARNHLGTEFTEKLYAYDPTLPSIGLSYAKSDTLKGSLGEVSVEEISKVSNVLPALLSWAKAALDVKDAAIAKRKREEEDAKAKAEAAAEGGNAEE